MCVDLDQLDQELMESIQALDVDRVRKAIRSGAAVLHKRKRDNMPVGPSITPVILSHRLKDVVADPGIKMIRKFPPKVLEHLKSIVKERTVELGEQEVQTRINAICKMIAAKLGM
ncbi:MAG: hypothetical protein AAGD07_23315 [Planctomycetota bacterium]